jgi:hypothetical protein
LEGLDFPLGELLGEQQQPLLLNGKDHLQLEKGLIWNFTFKKKAAILSVWQISI